MIADIVPFFFLLSTMASGLEVLTTKLDALHTLAAP